MIDKILISADETAHDCWRLAAQIVAAESAPFDVVVGLARGGMVPALYLHEFFMLYYRRPIGFAITRCRSYHAVARAGDEVKVGSLAEVWQELRDGSRILVVDDIFDRGKTAQATVNALRAEAPREVLIKTAMLHYKPENSVVEMAPDYYVRRYRGEEWIVYPYAASDVADDPRMLAQMGIAPEMLAPPDALREGAETKKSRYKEAEETS
jgi:hypoxanthine phosphoribosyltransferase